MRWIRRGSVADRPKVKKKPHWMYGAWSGMVNRCHNPNNYSYPRYGGRGITVCERWRSFENFLADMGERPEGMTLDRIDGTGPYAPENCRWATIREQRANITPEGDRRMRTAMSAGVKRHWREWRQTNTKRPDLTRFQQRNLQTLMRYAYVDMPSDGRAAKSFEVLQRIGLASINGRHASITEAGRKWLLGWKSMVGPVGVEPTPPPCHGDALPLS